MKNKMPWIVILGADGAGKSTVISKVVAYLGERNIQVNYQHWRPTIQKKQVTEGQVVTDPHALPPRGCVASWARVIILLVIWWYSFLHDIKISRKIGELVIFDRFYGDLLVDPRRYRYGGGAWYARMIFKMMPQPDLVILLAADAEVLYQRKPEVELGELHKIVARYRAYTDKHCKGRIINAEQTVDLVVADVLSELRELDISIDSHLPR
jgi:thymidylate kinase